MTIATPLSELLLRLNGTPVLELERAVTAVCAALEQARRIEFTVVPSERAQDRQHAFKIRVESEGELYVRVAKGVRAFGDYPLAEDYNAVVAVPELPREVQIEGQGGLLALNGDRKLSIRSRALPAVEFEVARVATTQINHLVSQTEGKFEDPEFRAPGSDATNE